MWWRPPNWSIQIDIEFGFPLSHSTLSLLGERFPNVLVVMTLYNIRRADRRPLNKFKWFFMPSIEFSSITLDYFEFIWPRRNFKCKTWNIASGPNSNSRREKYKLCFIFVLYYSWARFAHAGSGMAIESWFVFFICDSFALSPRRHSFELIFFVRSHARHNIQMAVSIPNMSRNSSLSCHMSGENQILLFN